MKTFISLAISCLLIGLLYIYTRQQIANLNSQLANLTDLVKTVAMCATNQAAAPPMENAVPLKFVELSRDDRQPVSDDEDEDEDSDHGESSEENDTTDGEHSSFDCLEVEQLEMDALASEGIQVQEMKEFVVPIEAPTTSFGVIEIPRVEEIVLNSDEPSLSKKVVLEPKKFNDMSLKELKDYIVQTDGSCPLKTKKAMVEYLEKKTQVITNE